MKIHMAALAILFLASCSSLDPNYPNPGVQKEFLIKSSDTDKILIRTGGTCHYTPGKEETIFETTDRKKISDIINNIIFLPRKEGLENSACCGDRTIIFYKEGSVMMEISIINKTRLRCKELARGSDTAAEDKTFSYLEKLMKEGRKKQLDDFLKDMNEKAKTKAP